MTYTVSGGMLNPTHSHTHLLIIAIIFASYQDASCQPLCGKVTSTDVLYFLLKLASGKDFLPVQLEL